MARVSYFHESAAHFVSEGVPVETAEAGVVFVPACSKELSTRLSQLEQILNLVRSRMKARSPSAATITVAISAQKRSSNKKSFLGWIAFARAALPLSKPISRGTAHDRSKHRGCPTSILSQ
jgi:hypothetical protein